MTYLIQENLALIIAAIVIGFVIGWWIWSRRRIAPPVTLNEDANRPTFARNTAPPEPIVTPTRPEADAEEALAASLLSIDPVSGIVAPPIVPIIEPAPIAVKKKPAAKPAAKPAVAPAAAKVSAKPAVKAAAKPATVDDLLILKGVGPKLVVLLNGLGVTSFKQIAGWKPADVARVDAQLGNFKGRIERDRWIEQAKLLAAGDVAGFEQRFGKAGV